MTETCLPIVQWLKNWFTSTDDLLDKTYPIGSIYMSVNSTSPQSLFGGTWQQLEDTFLYATSGTADTGYQATAGSKDAVVVSHSHTQNAHSHIAGDNWDFIVGEKGVNWQSSGGKGSIAQSGNNHYAYTSSSKSDMGQYHNTSNATPTINSNGVDGTGKNMPPYMKVYMWKRTA